MSDRNAEQERIKSYLLRQMSPEERTGFEEEYWSNPELFEELVATENQMIGAYLRNEGTDEERQRFVHRFLTTESGRQQTELARAWMNHTAPAQMLHMQAANRPTSAGLNTPRSRPRQRLAIAAMLLIVGAGTLWLALNNLQLRRQVVQLQSESEVLRRQTSTLQDQLNDSAQQQPGAPQQSNPHSTPHMPAAFVLSSSLTRGGGAQQALVVPRGAKSVRLQVSLTYNDYSAYNVAVETAEGKSVWHKEYFKAKTLSTGQSVILVSLPASVLQSRTYILHVSGHGQNASSTPVEDYSFHIAKQ